MRLSLTHTTCYRYSAPVSLSPHLLYLRPRESTRLRLLDFKLVCTPTAILHPVRDPMDNDMLWVRFPENAAEVTFAMTAEVETLDTNPFDFVLKDYALTFPFTYEPVFDFALAPYLAPPFAKTQKALRRWLDEHFPVAQRPTDTVSFISQLNSLFFSVLRYTRREEPGIQSSAQTMSLGGGACRDYAVLFIEVCRTLGLAARFVSGYLHTAPGDDARTAGAMHAWVEVYLPGAGWKGLDPTHGIWCDDVFVPVAHAAQAESVNPIQGNYYSPTPATSQLTTAITVEAVSPAAL